jgi:hypothetical protein
MCISVPHSSFPIPHSPITGEPSFAGDVEVALTAIKHEVEPALGTQYALSCQVYAGDMAIVVETPDGYLSKLTTLAKTCLDLQSVR